MSLFGGLEKLLGKEVQGFKNILGLNNPSKPQGPPTPAAPAQLNTGTLNPAIGQLLSPNGDQDIGHHPYPNITQGLRFNNGPTIGVSPYTAPIPLRNVLLPQNLQRPTDWGQYGDAQGNTWYENNDTGQRIPITKAPAQYDAPLPKIQRFPGEFNYGIQSQTLGRTPPMPGASI